MACVGALFVYVLVTAAIAGWQARSLAQSLKAAEASARALDLSALATELPAARSSAHWLELTTSGPVWATIGKAPLLGPSVSAGRTLAESVDSVLAATGPLQAPLDAVARGQLRTSDGSLDLALLEPAPAALRSTAAALRDASARLAAIDVTALPGPLSEALSQASAQLPDVIPLVATAADLADRGLPLLGAERPRTWLILLQNPSELRGTGGLVGGYALMTADKGRLSLTRFGPNDDLLKGGDIPSSSLPDDVLEMFNTDLSDWRMVNLSPHFPYTGQLSAAGMRQMGTPIDGVISVDGEVVAALLAATGPITVPGRTVTADTAADYITRQVYLDHTDVADKDTALLSLLQQTMGALTTGSPDLETLARGLLDSVRGGHLLAWSSDPDEESWFEKVGVAGSLSDAPGPSVAVALNNGSGNKVDAYVQATADYSVGQCPTAESQSSGLTLTLTNSAPDGLPPYVTQRLDDATLPLGGDRMLVDVYAPAGSLLLDATLDGGPTVIGTGADRGRPVWRFTIELDRDTTKTLELTFSEPTVADTTPSLWMPAMVRPAVVTVTPKALCSP